MEDILTDCISKIVKTIGVGFHEAVYHQAMIVEFKKRFIKFESEKTLEVIYDGIEIGRVRPDLIVDDIVIVEMKAIMSIGRKEHNQVKRYMDLTGIKEAYIVNVNYRTWEVIRVFCKI
jgi:GxxExxY protein